jgi:hypothetical protein
MTRQAVAESCNAQRKGLLVITVTRKLRSEEDRMKVRENEYEAGKL